MTKIAQANIYRYVCMRNNITNLHNYLTYLMADHSMNVTQIFVQLSAIDWLSYRTQIHQEPREYPHIHLIFLKF